MRSGDRQITGQCSYMTMPPGPERQSFSAWRLDMTGGTAAALPGIGLLFFGHGGLEAGIVVTTIIASGFPSVRKALRILVWYRWFFCIQLFGTLAWAYACVAMPASKETATGLYIFFFIAVAAGFHPLVREEELRYRADLATALARAEKGPSAGGESE